MYSLSPTNLHLIVKAGSSHPVPGLMRGAEGSGAVPIVPEGSSDCKWPSIWQGCCLLDSPTGLGCKTDGCPS